MSRFSNDTLLNFTKPVSGSEDTAILNVVNMVRDAVDACNELKHLDIEVFLQGSYANNTNVRQNSDVDINVCLKSTFYYQLPEGRNKDQYNIGKATTEYSDYKNAVEKALRAKFGKDNVKRKNKCIHIKENTYHHEADVVPTFEYRHYGYYDIQYTGVKFKSDEQETIVNFPKQQVANGTDKNNLTYRRYKRTVRILKYICYRMKDENVNLNHNVSSFLIESLVWNVPNRFFEEDDYNIRIRKILIFLYGKTAGVDSMANWNEESDLLPLFGKDRKWKVEDVRQFINQVYDYLGYANE